LGQSGWHFYFHVELPGAKTLHQQIIVGIFRAWTFQLKRRAWFGNPSENPNDEDANHAKDGIVHPLDFTFGRARLSGIQPFTHHLGKNYQLSPLPTNGNRFQSHKGDIIRHFDGDAKQDRAPHYD
jgi:hypothetical protein